MSLLKKLFGGSAQPAQPVQSASEQKTEKALPPVALTFRVGSSYGDASKVLEQMVPDLKQLGGSAYTVLPITPGHGKPHEGTLNRIKVEDNTNGYIEGAIRATDDGYVAFMVEFRPGASQAIRMGLQELVNHYDSQHPN